MAITKATFVSTKFTLALDWILGIALIALGILRFLLPYFEMGSPIEIILSVYYM